MNYRELKLLIGVSPLVCNFDEQSRPFAMLLSAFTLAPLAGSRRRHFSLPVSLPAYWI